MQAVSEYNRTDYLLLHHNISEKQPIFLKPVIYEKREGTIFHMHYAMELGILLSGSIDRMLPDFTFCCEMGDVWMTGMCEVHGYRVRQEPCVGLVFIISPEVLTRMRIAEEERFNALSPFVVDPEDRPKTKNSFRKHILSIADRARQHCNESSLYAKAWARTLVVECLLYLLEGWGNYPNIVSHSASSIKAIKRAIEIVFASKSFLKVEYVAMACGMNRSSFSRQFKHVLGLSFSQFSLRYRLSRAAEALITTDSPAKAVSAEWGFVDLSHLHRVFSAHYHCTPTEYRLRASNERNTTV